MCHSEFCSSLVHHLHTIRTSLHTSRSLRCKCIPSSTPQVYKAVLRDTGEEVAVKVQRPDVEPLIFRDLYIFRQLARFVTPFAMRKLGCNAELIVDEFGEKLLEELDYAQEARNIQVSSTTELIQSSSDVTSNVSAQIYSN